MNDDMMLDVAVIVIAICCMIYYSYKRYLESKEEIARIQAGIVTPKPEDEDE